MRILETHVEERLPDLVVFDLETSGFYFDTDEIIEIGAVRIAPDLKTPKGEFLMKVRPLHPETIDPETQRVNGYTREGWADARPLADVLRAFATFADGSLLAGYNVAFDWGFLKHAYRTAAIDLNVDYHIFDVMSLVLADTLKTGQPASIRLSAALKRLGLPPQPKPHRALEDAKATLLVLQALLKR